MDKATCGKAAACPAAAHARSAGPPAATEIAKGCGSRRAGRSRRPIAKSKTPWTPLPAQAATHKEICGGGGGGRRLRSNFRRERAGKGNADIPGAKEKMTPKPVQ